MAVFVGTVSNDSYLSTSAGDNATGLRGDDTLIGGAGRDTLNGNADNDLLFADSATQTAGGNDSLYGGQGADTLVGARFGFSADSLGGNRGTDLLIASTNGGNTLYGGQGDDTIYGSITNSNTMNGDLGSDVLIAGRGNDRMLGADGNDTMVGGTGNNDMFGESGNDQFQFFTAIPGDITLFTGAEQVVRARGGFGGSDTIYDFTTGDSISISQLDRNATVTVTTNAAGAAVITVGGTASDGQPAANTITVVGVTRDQLLAPGAQLLAINGSFITTNNTVNDGAGVSVFTVGQGQPGGNISGVSLVGSNVADAFSDDPSVATTANSILLLTTVNDDTLAGNNGDDFMFGSAGNDSINGGGSTALAADPGANVAANAGDTLIGGTGFDTLTGGGGYDNFLMDSFVPGVIDTITDYNNLQFDKVLISAAAFGGSLVPGQTASGAAPTLFFFTVAAGAVDGVNSAGPIGTSSFYYDTTGGGLYYDRDGAGTGSTYTRFANVTPLTSPITVGSLVIVA